MRKCCVPGCNSNHSFPYVPTFLFPKDINRRKLWEKKIGYSDAKISNNVGVCIKHFEPTCVTYYNSYKPGDGENNVEKKKVKLKPDAIPTIFPTVPKSNAESPLKGLRTRRQRRQKDPENQNPPKVGDCEPVLLRNLLEKPPLRKPPIITILKAEGNVTQSDDDDDDDESVEIIDLCDDVESSPATSHPSTPIRSKEEERRENPLRRTLSIDSNSSNGSTEVSRSPIISTKRRKTEKNPPTVTGRQNDCYCWVCHKEGISLTCFACPRAYHQRCAGEIDNSDEWVCVECRKITYAENVDNQSKALSEISLERFCMLLKCCVGKLKLRAPAAFHQPVPVSYYSSYLDYVIHPMDLSQIEKNVKQKMYGCTESFLADVKWLLHNSFVFNGAQHPLTLNARSLVKTCDNDLSEIEVCPDCFLHAFNRNKNWFSDICRKPHSLVWAKLKGFPYWPAKVARVVNDELDARFFGAHDRAWVPVSQCYHLSKEMPTSSKPKKKGNYEIALEELEIHVQLLTQKYGTFNYAPYRTSFDPTNTAYNYGNVELGNTVPGKELSATASSVVYNTAMSSRTVSSIPTSPDIADANEKPIFKMESSSTLMDVTEPTTNAIDKIKCSDPYTIKSSSEDFTDSNKKDSRPGVFEVTRKLDFDDTPLSEVIQLLRNPAYSENMIPNPESTKRVDEDSKIIEKIDRNLGVVEHLDNNPESAKKVHEDAEVARKIDRNAMFTEEVQKNPVFTEEVQMNPVFTEEVQKNPVFTEEVHENPVFTEEVHENLEVTKKVDNKDIDPDLESFKKLEDSLLRISEIYSCVSESEKDVGDSGCEMNIVAESNVTEKSPEEQSNTVVKDAELQSEDSPEEVITDNSQSKEIANKAAPTALGVAHTQQIVVPKKNDFFSLKLDETIKSCKAKLGLLDIDNEESSSSESSVEEEEDDDDDDEEEEEEIEDEENNDGENKVDSEEEESSSDSTSEDEDDSSGDEESNDEMDEEKDSISESKIDVTDPLKSDSIIHSTSGKWKTEGDTGDETVAITKDEGPTINEEYSEIIENNDKNVEPFKITENKCSIISVKNEEPSEMMENSCEENMTDRDTKLKTESNFNVKLEEIVSQTDDSSCIVIASQDKQPSNIASKVDVKEQITESSFSDKEDEVESATEDDCMIIDEEDEQSSQEAKLNSSGKTDDIVEDEEDDCMIIDEESYEENVIAGQPSEESIPGIKSHAGTNEILSKTDNTHNSQVSDDKTDALEKIIKIEDIKTICESEQEGLAMVDETSNEPKDLNVSNTIVNSESKNIASFDTLKQDSKSSKESELYLRNNDENSCKEISMVEDIIKSSTQCSSEINLSGTMSATVEPNQELNVSTPLCDNQIVDDCPNKSTSYVSSTKIPVSDVDNDPPTPLKEDFDTEKILEITPKPCNLNDTSEKESDVFQMVRQVEGTALNHATTGKISENLTATKPITSFSNCLLNIVNVYNAEMEVKNETKSTPPDSILKVGDSETLLPEARGEKRSAPDSPEATSKKVKTGNLILRDLLMSENDTCKRKMDCSEEHSKTYPPADEMASEKINQTGGDDTKVTVDNETKATVENETIATVSELVSPPNCFNSSDDYLKPTVSKSLYRKEIQEPSSQIANNAKSTPSPKHKKVLPSVHDAPINSHVKLMKLEEEVKELKELLAMLRSRYERQEYYFKEEVRERYHNTCLIMREMRYSLEDSKTSAIEATRRECELEKRKAVEEAKSKQWCASCKLPSIFYCCWNTSYCSYTCQKHHWPDHRFICSQMKTSQPTVTSHQKTEFVRIAKKPAPGEVLEGYHPERKVVYQLKMKPVENAANVNSSAAAVTATAVGNSSKPIKVGAPLVQFVTPKNQVQIAPSSTQSSASLSFGPSQPVQIVLAPVKANDKITPSSTLVPTQVYQDSADIITKVRSRQTDLSTAINLINMMTKETEETLKKQQSSGEGSSSDAITASSTSDLNAESMDISNPCDDEEESMILEEEESGDDDDNAVTMIGPSVELSAKKLKQCLKFGTTATKLVRCLLTVFYSMQELAKSSVFGRKSNVTKLKRPPLAMEIVNAILGFVMSKFPNSQRTELVLAMNLKCKEARRRWPEIDVKLPEDASSNEQINKPLEEKSSPNEAQNHPLVTSIPTTSTVLKLVSSNPTASLNTPTVCKLMQMPKTIRNIIPASTQPKLPLKQLNLPPRFISVPRPVHNPCNIVHLAAAKVSSISTTVAVTTTTSSLPLVHTAKNSDKCNLPVPSHSNIVNPSVQGIAQPEKSPPRCLEVPSRSQSAITGYQKQESDDLANQVSHTTID